MQKHLSRHFTGHLSMLALFLVGGLPIDRVEMVGAYINLFVDGLPLDGALVGYPNKFEVMK